ncbi:MAG: T9SS type A sorting domain-containing protein [Prevotella sp.]|nr:T9SS type A sorting domain-containing protein [Prevotella sp.]
MKKRFLTTVLIAMTFALGIYAGQRLTINGETVEKAVTQITFDGDQAVLHFADDTTESVDMNSVIMEFVITTGINTKNNAFILKGAVDGELNISGLETDRINIYDASGRIALSTRVSGSDVHIDARHLRSGMYILQAGNQIVKFMKR